jgi:hypothetical protein
MLSRYAPLLIGLVLGIAIGLFYGWVIQPVQLSQSTPDRMREDYRTDYVLLIAEAFSTERDSERALLRLKAVSAQAPVDAVASALSYAQANNFNAIDIKRLSELLDSLQSAHPSPEINAP